MLAALKAVLCLMFLLAGETAEAVDQQSPQPVHRKSRSMSANVGESVTVECFYDGGSVSVGFWYKQTLGEKPIFMGSFSPHSETVTFDGEFQNDPRFTSSSEKGVNRLVITDIRSSDSATYYCAKVAFSAVEFMDGTTVLVQGPGQGFPVRVHQWASGSNQSSGSVTLQCRVETGSCTGGARVYWFRESREAEAGVLYATGGSQQQQQQCVSNTSVQTHSCLYTLPLSLDPSHTGIYYCAVASCGRLLFGKGTKLGFGHEGHSPYLVIFLGAALAFTAVLSLLLAISLCMHGRNKRPAPVTANQEDGGNQHAVQYAALQVKKDRRQTRRGEEAEPECVYSRVKQ